MKLKKGDQVLVTGGKDKGKKGKVDRILPGETAIVIAGVNIYKRHVKKRDEKNPGGIIEVSRPLNVGKVVLICPKCKLPTRIGYSQDKKGEKTRMCRKCKQML